MEWFGEVRLREEARRGKKRREKVRRGEAAGEKRREEVRLQERRGEKRRGKAVGELWFSLVWLGWEKRQK